MRFAVTGAAGFVGSHLAEALIAAGHEVLALDAFTDYYEPALKRENARAFEVATIDLARDDLDLAGVDGIFHLAGQPGVRPSWGDFATYVERNLVASQRVFGSAARAGVRVVFASSSSVYGDAETLPTHEDAVPSPISPYGVTKLACEHLAHAQARGAGLDAVILRYFTVYGPRQRPDMAFTRMLSALAERSAFTVYGDGSQSRSFTFVDDAVRATIAAMEKGVRGRVYNVGGGTEATLREVVALAEEIAGAKLDLDQRPVAPGDARRTSADTSRIRSELGWAPEVPLADGLRAQWEWVSSRVAAR